MSTQYTTLNLGDEVIDYTRPQPANNSNKEVVPYDDRLGIIPRPTNNPSIIAAGAIGFIVGAICNEITNHLKNKR